MFQIVDITGCTILDSAGGWTVSVNVTSSDGIVGRAGVPHGTSRGSAEAPDVAAETAVQQVGEVMHAALVNTAYEGQSSFDARLRDIATEADEEVGASALLAVSVAAAECAAATRGQELWQYLAESYPESCTHRQQPRLLMNLIEGGVHAGTRLPFQEYLLIPETDDLHAAIHAGTTVLAALQEHFRQAGDPRAVNVGLEGGCTPALEDPTAPLAALEAVVPAHTDLAYTYGIDAAGAQLDLSHEEHGALFAQIATDYPLSFLEDPFDENDFAAHADMRAQLPEQVTVVGDDLTVTSVQRMQAAVEAQAISGIIIKPNQIGTLSEAMDAVALARANNWRVYVSHRSRETNDAWIVDVAWAVGADGCKFGAPQRGERVSKYNRLRELATEAG